MTVFCYCYHHRIFSGVVVFHYTGKTSGKENALCEAVVPKVISWSKCLSAGGQSQGQGSTTDGKRSRTLPGIDPPCHFLTPGPELFS